MQNTMKSMEIIGHKSSTINRKDLSNTLTKTMAQKITINTPDTTTTTKKAVAGPTKTETTMKNTIQHPASITNTTMKQPTTINHKPIPLSHTPMTHSLVTTMISLGPKGTTTVINQLLIKEAANKISLTAASTVTVGHPSSQPVANIKQNNPRSLILINLIQPTFPTLPPPTTLITPTKNQKCRKNIHQHNPIEARSPSKNRAVMSPKTINSMSIKEDLIHLEAHKQTIATMPSHLHPVRLKPTRNPP